MSALDKLARDVEQLEAGAESVAKIIMIMWNNLYGMSEENKVSIINNYISASFRANRNNDGTG